MLVCAASFIDSHSQLVAELRLDSKCTTQRYNRHDTPILKRFALVQPELVHRTYMNAHDVNSSHVQVYLQPRQDM